MVVVAPGGIASAGEACPAWEAGRVDDVAFGAALRFTLATTPMVIKSLPLASS